MTKPRTKRNAEPLPSHVNRPHSASMQQQRAGSSSAARQSIEQAWTEACANAERSLARVRARVRWE